MGLHSLYATLFWVFALAAPKNFLLRIYEQNKDFYQQFKNIYHPNAFDMALLIPYFIVLIWLATYGIHRYVLVYLYYKNRKNRTQAPAEKFAELPRVTVQLPIFNEQYVVERLLHAVCGLNYP